MEAPFFMSPRLTQMPSLGEAVEEAHVHHAGHFGVRRESRSSHTATHLALHLAACRRGHTAEGTASAAQEWCPGLAANVSLTAQESLLRGAADVVAFWDAAVVATAASMVYDHLQGAFEGGCSAKTQHKSFSGSRGPGGIMIRRL